MNDIFLTFLIITYKRPNKVYRLLEQFLDEEWLAIFDLKLEIVIADDHSNDHTASILEPIITKLRNFGWTVHYIYRESNLKGDLNLYTGLVYDSKGEYSWLLCDDDSLIVPEAIKFVKTIIDYKPLVAICGFRQGNSIKYTNNLGDIIKVSESFKDSVEMISHFPKTSTYVYKRELEYLKFEHFDRWNGTLLAWIGLGIYMVGKNNGIGVLLYPNITAYADDDYGLLRYGYRVFRNVGIVVRDSINLAGYNLNILSENSSFLKDDDELALNILGLQAHYSLKSDIKYIDKILKEEIRFLMKNFIKIFLKRKRIILGLKLCFVLLERFFYFTIRKESGKI